MTTNVHLLTGAYAADALDPDEKLEFEQHLAGCTDCQEEARTLRETVAALGMAAAEPQPEGLRALVLAQVRQTPQLPPASGRSLRPTHRWVGAPWLGVAAAGTLIAGIGIGVLSDRYDANPPMANASTTLKPVTGKFTGKGQLTVVTTGSQAVVVSSAAAALPAGRTYQLWLVRGEQAISAGVSPVGLAAGGTWSRTMTGVRPGDKLAITIEPEGGSVKATTEAVSVLKL